MMEDWGATVRLFDELDGAGEAAEELELMGDPAVLREMWRATGRDAAASANAPPYAYRTMVGTALRAHCMRGDHFRAGGMVTLARRNGIPLATSSYADLFDLALKTRSPAPLLSLQPDDLARTAASIVEPAIFGVQNRLSIVGSMLGSIERIIVLVSLLAAMAAAIILVTSPQLTTASGVDDLLNM